MANKFNLIGVFDRQEEDQIFVNVQRNYRNYESQYDVDVISLVLGITLLPQMIKSIKQNEVVAINGRVESDQESQVVLVAEHIIRIEHLKM